MVVRDVFVVRIDLGPYKNITMVNEKFDFDILRNLSQDTGGLSASPLKILANWYLADCEAENLQPESIRFYEYRLRYLYETLGDIVPSEISTAHLRALLLHLRKTRNWSVQNTNHCVQVWKGFFHYLEQEELLEENPARRLKKLRQETKFPKPFSIEEVSALLSATAEDFCGIRDRTMMLMLLDTGIRTGELLRLQPPDVNLASGILKVFGKGRKERFLPFQRTVRRALLKYVALRKAMFRHLENEDYALWLGYDGNPFKRDGLQRRLRDYGRTLKIMDVHPHRFRHTFATEFLRNGGNPQMLQQILGHTTPIMTQRYVHMTDEDAKRDHLKASPVERWGIGNKRGKTRERSQRMDV